MARLTLVATTALIGAAFALTACAPKDEAQAPKAIIGSEVQTQAAQAAERDLEFSHHMLVQLGEARRLMDTALNFRLVTRQNGDLAEVGCRQLKKLVSDHQGSAPMYSERFEIKSINCLDQSQSQKIKSARRTGVERYHLAYTTPFPKKDEKAPIGIPVNVVVDGREIENELLLATKGDSGMIWRTSLFSAELVNDDGTTLTYAGSFDQRDRFKINDAQLFQIGLVRASLSDIEIKVSKVDRKVVSLAPVGMKLSFNGDRWSKKGADLVGHQALKFEDWSMESTAPVALPSSVCMVPEGSFRIKRGAADPFFEADVKSQNGLINLNSKADVTKTGKICDDSESPLFAEDFESLFL